MGDFTLPQLVVRASLTGHRPNRLGISSETLGKRIEKVLDQLESVAKQIAMEEPGLYDQKIPLTLRFTTGLARGTDEIGAETALKKGWQLQSVIAFDRHKFVELAVAGCSVEEASVYRRHYDSLLTRSCSVLEIQGPENGGFRRDGYELVGEILLEQADVLIGVWDGEPAQGLGGSAHVMRLALRRGLPVVWIDAVGQEDDVRIYLPGKPVSHDLAELTNWLHDSLRLPNAPHDLGARKRWIDFVNEDGECTGKFPPLYQYLLTRGGRKRPRGKLRASDSESGWRNNWAEFRDEVEKTDASIAARIDKILWPAFHRADHLAEVYGRAYRGTYVLTYLLVSLATTVGLLGLLSDFFHEHKPVLVLLEMILISGMIFFTGVGRKNRWHERWLDYRNVAEQLRLARMGIWTGQSLNPADPEAKEGHAGISWATWYVRACVRQLPMIHASATDEYLHRAIDSISRLEIEDQRVFNERTAKVQKHVHEWLEKKERLLVFALIAACILFLGGMSLLVAISSSIH